MVGEAAMRGRSLPQLPSSTLALPPGLFSPTSQVGREFEGLTASKCVPNFCKAVARTCLATTACISVGSVEHIEVRASLPPPLTPGTDFQPH